MFNARRIVLPAAALLAVVIGSQLFAEPKEQPGMAPDKGDWTMSPLRLGTMPAMTVMQTTYQTTFAEMDKVGGEIEELIKAVTENQIQADGFIMFVYKGVQQDRTKPFQLSIAMSVPADTKAVGKYEVKALPPFKNASTMYNGGLMSIGNVYQKHYTDLIAAGHLPTDEARELYLYWEGHESDNNVVWIQAGIQ